MKNKPNKFLLALCMAIALFSQANAATVGFGTALGTFLLSDGSTAPTTGGISIGFFTGSALPTKVQLSAITSDPYGALVNTYNFVDLRNLKDSSNVAASFQSGGSWDFSLGWTGATLNVPNTPGNYSNAINGNDVLATFTGGTGGTATTLWTFAFNGGNYANGFSGTTQWAAVTATEPGQTLNDWLYPTSSETIQLNQINTAGEVLVGTDSGANNIYMAALIPEPTSLNLFLAGAIFLSSACRKRKIP